MSLSNNVQLNVNGLDDSNVLYAVEGKAPYFNQRPHMSVPPKYVSQIEAEMCALQWENALYISYTHKVTTAFTYRNMIPFLMM